MPVWISNCPVVVMPFMSVTMQRTVRVPAVLQLFAAVALLFAVNVPSPQSQKYASVSPSESVAVAVKATLPLIAGFKVDAPNETNGLWFPAKAPRFTVTSIHATPFASVPRSTGVMWMPAAVSEKVRPISSGASSSVVVPGAQSSSSGFMLLMFTSPQFSSTPSFAHAFVSVYVWRYSIQ